ncbi:LpxL/LpxP family Kdo(2)-lipid IV(A) lauroyl/palmitoleoyl acyltransferase [Pleionea litopenaei]|uniref:LpxL/LpxP family Kdo(2)-lipid IV(A) lauroyl/palmitoleoyl acyltransferase n=1 Tax=Pleionea litopenaei TaxID=3070815 RepID=A0AA51RRP7_9GAMM|nr:LpxL/LpxP family Kdo(2)-lipid IV(A) lauroyl/palmitoleoyl acyltransferase [Pleionea sp. HL-JVS1]WMS86327.1 LpxL/LpxP family Kdo(2)-lipid IV(A) lauroyl/palmitoleoyl acyltransferase [Pleionea sp. HL-JVS1]
MSKIPHIPERPSGIQHWPTWAFFGLMSLFGRLPYPAIKVLGKGIGLLMYRLAKSRVRIATINIQLCFPHLNEQQQAALVRENLIETGIGMLETSMLWFGGQRRWSKLVSFKGLEHLDAALAEGRGGLLLAFHLTSLEIGGSLLGTRYKIGALYRRNEDPAIEYAMCKGRSKFVDPIPREATRDMIKYLKNNQFVWYAADQDYGRRQSIFVPFFNIPTATITATTRFAKLSKSPVIPMTQQRLSNGTIEVTIHPPLPNIGNNEEQDALTINQFLESYLTQHPADYLWVHRRFKTRPSESDASLYPEKKKNRPVTPERYKNIIEAADWVEGEPPEKLFVHDELVYFYYYKGLLQKSRWKQFISQIDEQTLDGETFRYQGKVRHCAHKQCYLVYLQK